jgi:predicted O-methyltransferase YrrM
MSVETLDKLETKLSGDCLIDEQSLRVLRELEKTQHDFWNISRASANFLNMLIKISGAKRVLEVGTSNGYSGIWIAKALKETAGVRGRLITIEYSEQRIAMAQENFKKCGVDDIITIKQGSACEVLETLDYGATHVNMQHDKPLKRTVYPEFDLAFIDANKSEYIKYFELIDPKLRSGGIIVADNITSHAEKVAPFVEKIKSDPNYQVEILDLPGGMLLAYKL